MRQFAPSTVTVLSRQAKPTAWRANAAPLLPRGSWLARLIPACRRPRPASTPSIPNSARKLVISVAPRNVRRNFGRNFRGTFEELRKELSWGENKELAPRQKKHGRGQKNVILFTSSAVFADNRAAYRSATATNRCSWPLTGAPLAIAHGCCRAMARAKAGEPRPHAVPGSATGIPVLGKCQARPGQLVVIGGARPRET